MGEMADMELDGIMDEVEEWDGPDVPESAKEDGYPKFHPFHGDAKP